jgi:hypothetical protein
LHVAQLEPLLEFVVAIRLEGVTRAVDGAAPVERNVIGDLQLHLH